MCAADAGDDGFWPSRTAKPGDTWHPDFTCAWLSNAAEQLLNYLDTTEEKLFKATSCERVVDV